MTFLDEETAYQLSHNWFLIDGKDFQVVDGVSIGLVLQLVTFEFFFKNANETRQRKGCKGLLKKKHLEWQARFLYSYLTQWKVNLPQVDLVTVFGVNNSPMIESANLVAHTCSSEQLSTGGIVVDKSIHLQVASTLECYYWTSAYGIVDELHVKRIAREQLKIFTSLHGQYCNNLDAYKIKKSRKVKFLKFIRRQIPQLCREIVALSNLLTKLAPKAILLASDAHRIERIIVQVAKKQEVATYVVQHGAPIWRYGYVPVVADKMLVWGEDAFNWFVKHGVPSEKLVIVGNPRFDKLAVINLEKKRVAKMKLFLLPNPIDRDLTSKMISSFISAVRFHDGPAIIKLHPSETDIDWFRDQIPEHLKSKIQISTLPLAEVGISMGDVAVVGNSTAGVDVVLLGGTIVNVKLPGMPNPIPYSKYKVGVDADLENIGDAIFRVKINDQEQRIKNRKIFLEKFLYRLDGKSAKRASTVIINGKRATT